ncbi:MAG: asparagine synthase (glutamine-hydrolyzing) [Polyangiales bacterium]
MCGIAGLIRFAADLPGEELAARATRMAAAVTHRGPDAEGVYADGASGVALSHRRLSILDLSEAGAQPMRSHDGRLTIVFNGEIYNHAELRAALAGCDWRGHSDTEVLLEALARWGVEAALRRAVGMFAFAVWDAADRSLVLARDRMGEKPLYYGVTGDALVFGSELKALRAAPGWRAEVDRDALDDFMRHGCVHAPRSIYRDARKLPPGAWLRVPLARAREALTLAPSRYWSLEDVAARAGAAPAREEDAVDELERLLQRAVAGQVVADVPVGAFLSGGIDSSTVVALMQAASTRKVRTFSIGFHEPKYNEAEHAAQVAAHLGTDHTELYVTLDEARAVIPDLPRIYDEPFADSSQIPTYLVSKLARRGVTVSLSGDGGDELFGGYSRYTLGDGLWRYLERVPRGGRAGLAAGLRSVPPGAWDSLFGALPRRLRVERAGDKLYKLAGLAGARDAREVHTLLMTQYREADAVVEGARTSTAPNGHGLWDVGGRRFTDNMMLGDALWYLPDVILVKVDRAAMAVSLETRAPFLDHRVVEFAFGLAPSMKIRGGVTKWILRRVLDRHVPRALIERPKMGFNVPIELWLRGSLRQWAEDLLAPDRLRAQGYLRADVIQSAWRAHLSGARNLEHFLWNALMFQAWLDG